MKKRWLLILILFLVGCSKGPTKELVCNQELGEFNFSLMMKFDNIKIKDINFECTSDISKYNEIQVKAINEKDFCSIVKETMKGYENSFIDCKQDISNNHLLISSKLDINLITNKRIKKIGDIEDGKKVLENEGYTCMIK